MSTKRGKQTGKTAPAAIGRTSTTKAAKMRQTGTGVTITHKEFFSTMVSNGTNYTALAWTVQPSYVECFPWLSNIAVNYQEYKIHSLSYEFNSRVPTSSPGSTILAFNPDPDDQVVAENEVGRQQLLSLQGATENSIWTSSKMTVSAKNFKRLFTRSTGTVVAEDRTSDNGVLTCFLTGSTAAAGTVVGDLLVKYTIEFSRPAFQFGYSSVDALVDRGLIAVETSNGTDFASSLTDATWEPLFKTAQTLVLNGVAAIVDQAVWTLSAITVTAGAYAIRCLRRTPLNTPSGVFPVVGSVSIHFLWKHSSTAYVSNIGIQYYNAARAAWESCPGVTLKRFPISATTDEMEYTALISTTCVGTGATSPTDVTEGLYLYPTILVTGVAGTYGISSSAAAGIVPHITLTFDPSGVTTGNDSRLNRKCSAFGDRKAISPELRPLEVTATGRFAPGGIIQPSPSTMDVTTSHSRVHLRPQTTSLSDCGR